MQNSAGEILLHPRNVVWLVNYQDWTVFEKIVKYNCALLGGIHNLIISLNKKEKLNDCDLRLLSDYDPDLIVLPPNADQIVVEAIDKKSFPFKILSWDQRRAIHNFDPLSGGTGMNLTLGLIGKLKDVKATFAVAEDSKENLNKLAFVACGDVKTRRIMFTKMDDEVHVNSSGYREIALGAFLKKGIHSSASGAHQHPDTGNIIEAPDRYRSKEILEEDSCFPLNNDPVSILKACAESQNQNMHFSFTAYTKKGLQSGFPYNPNTKLIYRSPPFVILVSKKFDTEIACMYWNLRADYTTVAWLPFDFLEKDPKGISDWLNSDYGGKYYTLVGNEGIRKGNLTFATTPKQIGRLKKIIDKFEHPKDGFSEWNIESFKNLKFYISGRPIIDRETTNITESNSIYNFITPAPENGNGVASATLKMNKLHIPNKSFVRDLLSDSILKAFYSGIGLKQIPKFRINNGRSITYQVQNPEHIKINAPSAIDIANAIVRNGDYTKIKKSANSNYQLEFLSKIGGLANVPKYLGDTHLRTLFEILGDNKNKHLPGWILNSIKRRGVHHLHLKEIFENKHFTDTQKYIDNEFDELPEDFVELLKKRIIERGFLLKCHNCSFSDWYRTDELSQDFKCNRCYIKQSITSNPVWLYKLTEVIFQGFSKNMEVPLLSLSYLKEKRSKKNFLWSPDLDLYWTEDGESKQRNIDFFVIIDGKSYLGEAKSTNYITENQFKFYKSLLIKLEIDGLIFSTSQNGWKKSTKSFIEDLKRQTSKEIISLTKNEIVLNDLPNSG